ncbi:HAD family hydrolase [Halohasta litorea]|uniref:HAD family hydrolase n=1 Tax=Halohasta litorea TaxID=869891 RepID=A0ABD6D9E3_9EURY|nr:HAD family phosphatase [Halohasta litorea]MEA1931167.1 HAD family phosphatase [Euryarchaeota archaeon]
MVTVVLFDMDGVLVDSERYWERHWEQQVFPRVQSGEPVIDDITGRSIQDIITVLDSEYGLPVAVDTFQEEIEAFADEMYREKATVTPGMESLFAGLQDRGLTVAVVSSALNRWIAHVIEHSELNPAITVSAEDIDAPSKPNPAIYTHAMDRLGVDPSECLVVEDSVQGVKAGNRADTTVIRYQCNQRADPIPESDYVAENITELREKIVQLSNEA